MRLTDSFIDEEENYCLVMDLMADDIKNIVHMCGAPLEEAFAKDIFKQMVEAVAHCHRNDIVHRDIKLENFLLNINEET